MATQQVKFHSVTAQKYNAIQTPDFGSLYFISDNGEIRKGSQHVTGTRVYNAVDSTGITKVESLTITFGGTSITSEGFPTDNLPKKGDMLVVEHTLAAASGTEGESGYVPAKKEYAAYIYSANGGAYSASNWQACDGNVDASKVILTQDITMAGNYTQVGNLTKSQNGTGTFETQGISVAEALQTIFTKKLQPTVSAPAVTLTIGNQTQSIEAGETSAVPTFSASLSAGSYTYGPATGVTAQSWSVSDGTNTYNTSSGNLPTIVANDGSQSYTVTATATHNAGATPKDNLGGNATVSGIAAGDKSASKTVTVTGYRKGFYLVLENADMVDVATDATKINSSYLRTNGHGAKAATPTSISATAGFQQILIFLPKNAYGSKKLVAETMKGLPYIDTPKGAESREITIAGAGSDAGIAYSIWEIKLGSQSGVDDTVKITWS